MPEIPNVKPGDAIEILDAEGVWHPARATSQVEQGRDFPIVWVERPLHGVGRPRHFIVANAADAVRLTTALEQDGATIQHDFHPLERDE